MEARPRVLGLLAGQLGLVVERVLKGERKGSNRPIHVSLGEAKDCARVDPTAQVAGDLDVGYQALADGVVEHCAEAGNDLLVRTIVGGQLGGARKLQIPIRVDTDLAAL